MNNILDHIAASARFSEFRPKTLREFFALRLAEKLDDVRAARHYLDLTEEHAEARLLSAYFKARVGCDDTGDLARCFHVELARGNEYANGSNGPLLKLAAIKIERRSVAAAVFNGEHLDYTQVRQLSSSHEKAEASATGFVNWICGNFAIESAALESMPAASAIQRSVLTRSIITELRTSAITVWEVPKPQLLHAYGYPPPKARKELREAVHSIWPILNDDTGVLDAAALGLYVQTERLFSN